MANHRGEDDEEEADEGRGDCEQPARAADFEYHARGERNAIADRRAEHPIETPISTPP
ncbi:hypothetical protein [Halocalculus aciditolerans]|uniref:hypothetical protein n=1 Tax=Halocalculus aciditolerans TaxID=1383812 RepID=UPI00166DB061|nr:hypothetical protein [Halocalculus aciditolerans]